MCLASQVLDIAAEPLLSALEQGLTAPSEDTDDIEVTLGVL